MDLDNIINKEKPTIINYTVINPIYDPMTYDSSSANFTKYDTRDYKSEREMHMNDFRIRADKTIQRFPQGSMPGVLGFTYLGENVINLRQGTGAYDVELDNQYIIRHESGHTPDELETRVIDHVVNNFAPVALNEIYPKFLPKYKV